MPMDSCRGLCLFVGIAQQHSGLHVVNPATKQILELPSIGIGNYKCCHLSYVSQSGKYKVVCCFLNSGNINWLVFTLGTDVLWRKLNIVLVLTQEEVVYPTTSVTVGQFLYFSQCRRDIAAVNLHDETVSSIQVLNAFICCSFNLLQKVRWVCCVARQGRVVHMSVLTDSEECEWIKDCDYKRLAINNKHCDFSPVGWLDNGQIFVSESRPRTCGQNSLLIVHFAETGKSIVIAICEDFPYRVLIHNSSLV